MAPSPFRIVLVLALAGASAAPALAQHLPQSPPTPVASFGELPRVVSIDQAVLVTDASQRTVKGRVVAMSDSSLVIQGEPTLANPMGQWTYQAGDVRRIRKPDSVLNGMFLGLAAGIGGMVAFTWGICGQPGDDPECAAVTNAIGLVSFVPGGMIAGALIDKFHMRTLFRAPAGSISVAVTPIVGKNARGVVMRFSF